MSNFRAFTERSDGNHRLRLLSEPLSNALALLGIAMGCIVLPGQAIADTSVADLIENEASEIQSSAADTFLQAEALAAQAIATAQTAATATAWDAVAAQWIEAIALLQTIPPENPSRIVAQRQLRGYLQQLQDAQRRAAQASSSLGLASLGSDLFDAQLAGYVSYIDTVGTPDVLIIGSSRALQGIDPSELQQALAARGYGDLNVYNFSVNGATAQVVEFVVGNLLPEPLPPIVVWGDGSRAFNEGRRDRTWEALRASLGYQGDRISADMASRGTTAPPIRRVTANSPLTQITGNLDALGFSAVRDRFDPQAYYQQIPKVEGRYDGDYIGFALDGAQANALGRVAAKMKNQGVQLMFVNLPLSGSYLDNFRLYYEQQFQRFLQAQGNQHGFTVVDLLAQWQNQPGFFADPSHINQEGASAIAQQLAQQPALIKAIEELQFSERETAPTPEPLAPEPSTLDPAISDPSPEPAIPELLRPARTKPPQNAPARRPPPPIPPPPSPRN